MSKSWPSTTIDSTELISSTAVINRIARLHCIKNFEQVCNLNLKVIISLYLKTPTLPWFNMYFNTVAFTSVALLILQHATPSLSALIDFSLIESAPSPPHDIDISQDHPLESYNIEYNSSWFITNWRGTSPLVWVHESRLPAVNTSVDKIGARSERNWILATAKDSEDEGSGSGASCPDTEHLFEISCINLRSLLDDDVQKPNFSWNIGEEGPSGHAGVWLFDVRNCDGDARYGIRELDGCAEMNKMKSVVWSTW